MKTAIFLISFVAVLIGCSSSPGFSPPDSVATAATIPVSMSCPGSLDPNQGCPNPSDPVASLRRESLQPRASARDKVEQTVTGRCELQVIGESSVRPCTELKLELKAMVGNETRQAVVDGFNFRVGDLTKDDYRLVATSEKFQLETDRKPLQAGQIVKIRIRAKPLSR